MTVFYENDFHRVHSSWFTSWRVTDLIAGVTIVPSPEASMKVSQAWRILQGRKARGVMLSKRAAENVLFDWFARAVIDPKSLAAIEFATYSPNHIAAVSIEGGNMQHQPQ